MPVWWVELVADVLTWAGASLLIDAWMTRRTRPSLSERLLPHRERTLGDEAGEWLRQQG